MKLICPICSKEHEKTTGHYNRAIKLGAKLYCSKTCFSAGRKLDFDKHLKTTEQLKAEKAEYDRLYREKNAERLKIQAREYFVKDYAAKPEKYREQRQKRMPKHIEYCRLPKARAKEKEARYRRLGQDKTKVCLHCNQAKRLIDFESFLIFPDKRNYICKECENTHEIEWGITTREVLATMRSVLVKQKSVLKIKDLAKYPDLIDANKYLLLLKRLTK